MCKHSFFILFLHLLNIYKKQIYYNSFRRTLMKNLRFCYEMTIVKWKYHISLIIVFSSFFCVILIKDIGQETSIQIYRRLATLLFVDWLPQVNGFAASFFVYSRESNLWNKKCLHRIILNNLNYLLIEISCPIASILFLLLSIYFNNDNLKFYLISLNPSIINYINQYDLS